MKLKDIDAVAVLGRWAAGPPADHVGDRRPPADRVAHESGGGEEDAGRLSKTRPVGKRRYQESQSELGGVVWCGSSNPGAVDVRFGAPLSSPPWSPHPLVVTANLFSSSVGDWGLGDTNPR